MAKFNRYFADKEEFKAFIGAFPPPVLEFLNENTTQTAMDKASEKLRTSFADKKIGGTDQFHEGMIEGLKCGLVVFYDMATEGVSDPLTMESCLLGGIVSSVAFIEMCYALLLEGSEDESRESDGS